MNKVDLRLLNSIHIFCRDEQWFCFHKESNRLFEITNSEASILQYLIEHPDDESLESKKVLEELTCFLGTSMPVKHGLDTINTFYLRLNRRCNLCCQYCRAIVPPESANGNQVIDPILASSATATMWELGAKGVGIHGGEPFVDWENTLAVLKAIRHTVPEIEIGITCNGTLVNQDIVFWLEKLDVIVSVELDGSSAYHNIFKKYSDGRSSFEDALAGAQLLEEHGLLAAIESTVSGLEGYDYEGYHYLKQLFPNTPIIVSRIKDHMPSQWVCHGDKLKSFLTQQIENVDYTETVMNDAVAGLINSSLHPTRSRYRCVCFLDKVSIDIDGAVYICPKEESYRTYIGRVDEKDFKTNFNKNRILAAQKFSAPPVKEEWYSYLIEHCIDITKTNEIGQETLQDDEIIGDFFEDLLFLSSKRDTSFFVDRWIDSGF